MECIQCLYSDNHPFGLEFDRDGLCTGCITHQEKLSLDWDVRLEKLRSLVQEARKVGSASYDCVVPVRGTPEYFFVLDVVINVLGLRPLVVSYNSHFNSQVGIANIDRMRERFDVDFHMYATNRLTYQKVVRETLSRFGNLRWPYIAGETSFPIRVADELEIPLVIWPYHQPTEQVGMHSYTEEAEMSRRSREEFDLMGLNEADLFSPETLLTQDDLVDFRYPPQPGFYHSRIRSIYLSNFIPWDSRSFSEIAIEKLGALGAKNWRTFDTYDRIDDLTYMSVHDLLKSQNVGYSRVTDSLCREIRFNRITKPVARELEAFYQAQWPTSGIGLFASWLGLKEDSFLFFLSGIGVEPKTDEAKQLSPQAKDFVAAYADSGQSNLKDSSYTLYGKGLDLEDESLPKTTQLNSGGTGKVR